MSIRALACVLLLAAASAQAAAPAKKKAPPEAPPQELDLDAMARAKDVDAQKTPPQDAATEEPSTTEPAATATTGAADTEPAPTAATADADAKKTESAAEPAAAANKPDEHAAQDAVALTPPIDAKEKRLATSCESRSTTLLDAAQKGDFDAASKDFDAKMRSALPPAKFKETWESLAQFGALQARGQAHPAKGEGYFIVMTPLIFEKATLVAQVACGSDARIAGFYVKPLSALQP